MLLISNKHFDEERSLYNLKNTKVFKCVFAGPLDGESVLKETRNCQIDNCKFSLRYPLWHAQTFALNASTLDELTRAPIWYSNDGSISHSTIKGIKCLRECHNIKIYNCQIASPEFGWMCSGISVKATTITSEYVFFHSENLTIDHLTFTGKYSFQYTKDVTIVSSTLDTKDAFWHSKNVTVKDSYIKGEYLAWFSEGLTLINCTIEGTQPFCYCRGLKLINCIMKKCDLAFEYSEVEATIKGEVDSIKNPLKGHIYCDSLKELIKENPVYPCLGEVIVKGKKAN
jgi:hypothetical protein